MPSANLVDLVMRSSSSLLIVLFELWTQIPKNFQLRFFLLLLLAVVSSLAEVISIGAILPFLGAITDPQKLFDNPYMAHFFSLIGISNSSEILIPVTILFTASILTAGIVRLILLRTQISLNQKLAIVFGVQIYKNTLYQPYLVQVGRNSSEVIASIVQKVGTLIGSGVHPVVSIVTSIIMILIIMISLIILSPIIAISSVIGFSVIYILISLLSKKRLAADSKRINSCYSEVIKVLQEGLGGIRDVILTQSQEVYVASFRSTEIEMREAMIRVQLISSSPRYIIETLGMLLIAYLALYISKVDNGDVGVIPLLGALALSAQRVLPLLQQTYAGWTSLMSGKSSMEDALSFLKQSELGGRYSSDKVALEFKRHIILNAISFRYPGSKSDVLKNVNLLIPKGERIGFIGNTGGGKSTLLDIVMGLLRPTEGVIKVDDIVLDEDLINAWQKKIAHVPQSIFLSDSTVLENIAFGVPTDEIDEDRVREAALKAQIHHDIDSWPLGYGTIVGERGVKISGGQRQRLGIARALYRKAEILVFDEATSALDNETEGAVMNILRGLSKKITVLIIAHRVTTLQGCSRICRLHHGEITEIGTYQEVIGHANSF